MQMWSRREFREAGKRAFDTLMKAYNLPARSNCMLISWSIARSRTTQLVRLGKTPGDTRIALNAPGVEERARRLAAHIETGHVSARESRDGMLELLGGAVLAREGFIISAMGLGEALDEALVLLVARELCDSAFSVETARAIAAHPNPAPNNFALRLLDND